MAMANADSVTVSMGDDTSGVFMVICLVSADVRSYKNKENAMHYNSKEYTNPSNNCTFCSDNPTQDRCR